MGLTIWFPVGKDKKSYIQLLAACRIKFFLESGDLPRVSLRKEQFETWIFILTPVILHIGISPLMSDWFASRISTVFLVAVGRLPHITGSANLRAILLHHCIRTYCLLHCKFTPLLVLLANLVEVSRTIFCTDYSTTIARIWTRALPEALAKQNCW